MTALLHLAVAGAAGRTDTSGLDRWTLTLHADIADIADLADPATDEARVSGAASAATAAANEASAEADRRPGQRIPVWSATGRTRTMSAATMRRIACEAGITLVIDGPDGTPLDVGRRQREPTVAQRRALYARDRSCRFPGCEATRHLHAHHVVHWADDGPTDLANLVLVCSYHHRFVHEHRWRVSPAAAGTFSFAPPDGDPLPRARILDAADDGWTHDPLEDDRLRATHRHGDELDVGVVVQLLHQELRHAAGIPTAA